MTNLLLITLIFIAGCAAVQCPPHGAVPVNEEMSCDPNSIFCDNGTDEVYRNCVFK